MPPVHPDEILNEEFLGPITRHLSTRLAKAIGVDDRTGFMRPFTGSGQLVARHGPAAIRLLSETQRVSGMGLHTQYGVRDRRGPSCREDGHGDGSLNDGHSGKLMILNNAARFSEKRT